MGKKRVTYDLNEDNKPPHRIVNDHHHHHHHHHHHRHQNRQKSKKIKPEAKLLHTLNSHLKKIAKSRSRKTISLSTPPPTKGLHENNKQKHVHFPSWLKNDDIDQHYDNWFMGFEFEHDNAYFDNGGEMGIFEFGQELLCCKNMTFIGSESNEDHFGWDCVFGPELTARHNLVFVFEEDGFIYGSVPDPVMNFEGMYICDVLELSSQEEMINEFIKVNLFVS